MFKVPLLRINPPLKVLAPLLTSLVKPSGRLVLSGILERQWKEDNAFFKVTSPNHSYFSDMGMPKLLKSVEKVNDLTVKITLNQPEAPFLANLAMLSGLLGTVSGLIVSFGAVSGESVDPSQKARILAEGISEAMNCTAFGLIVALIGLLGFAVLNGKTQGLEDDINEASVRVLNLVVANRQKVNLQGLEG